MHGESRRRGSGYVKLQGKNLTRNYGPEVSGVTSSAINAFVFALMLSTGVDPLDVLGRNVSRSGRLVFHSQHVRRDVLRHLVWTRLGFGCPLSRLPPLELSLGVFFLEDDVQSLLQNLRHMPFRILDAHDFGQSLELSPWSR